MTVDRVCDDRTLIELRSVQPDPPPRPDSFSDQQYTIDTSESRVTIAGTTPLGVVHGVYDLLERLGVGFFLGPDAFPDARGEARIAAGLHVSCEPRFAVRGSNLHGNLLAGASGWSSMDWRLYIDQMARMRCNLFMLHVYSSEPGAGCEIDGRLTRQGQPHSSLRPLFGIRPARTCEFSFGHSVYFKHEVFGAPPVSESDDPSEQIAGMEDILRETIRYGRSRGVYAAVGFDVPSGVDPTSSRVRREFEEQVRQFLRRYPGLAYLCLWQPESHGVFGEDIPTSRSASRLIARNREAFAYLWSPRRVYAGIHLTEFALLAHCILREEAPDVRLVISGWGGDRWMRFADFAQGLDRRLPRDVILTCHENADCTLTNTVSEALGRQPADRVRWAQPWIESDGDECWTRQANVEPLARLLPDALSKGCGGALALHWRTRDFEEELRYLARFSWEPDLTTGRFYSECARLMFGADHERAMGEALGDLQRLGGRLTGIHGGLECAPEFRWTGRKPHWPYELDSEAVEWVKAAAHGATDLMSRHGFRAAAISFARIVSELDMVSRGDDPRESLNTLKGLEAEAFGVWNEVLAAGVPTEAWETVHGVAERLHYLTTRAGHARRTRGLTEIRDRISRARREIASRAPRLDRLERLDYLLNTINVVLALDRVSVALADPGPVAEALSQARAAALDGDRPRAAHLASSAYQHTVAAAIREMLESQAAKLSSQCEWAVLALMHLKAVPAYWQTVAQAEELMPIAPPREVHLTPTNDTVRITWHATPRAAAHHLYRRKAGDRDFRRITREPLALEQSWLPPWYPSSAERTVTIVDRPPEPGVYYYAVSALDADRWESPRSHAFAVSLGPNEEPPRILGSLQGFCLEVGRSHEVSVIVLPSNGDAVAHTTLYWRPAGEERWRENTMLRGFRRSWHGLLPAPEGQWMAVEYYVEAVSARGASATWPASAAEGRQWTAAVLDLPSRPNL